MPVALESYLTGLRMFQETSTNEILSLAKAIEDSIESETELLLGPNEQAMVMVSLMLEVVRRKAAAELDRGDLAAFEMVEDPSSAPPSSPKPPQQPAP